MNVLTLRSILGNSVRFRIVVAPVAQQQHLSRAPDLAAVWSCGCEATGTTFRELSVSPCAAHRATILSPVA